MFSNEVLISKEDKQRLMALLKEADSILSKYPYENHIDNVHTVTTMSRAKGHLSEAVEWCGYLHTEKE